MLVIFSGGSGVGKNTVIAEFLKRKGFSLMPTYTTRNRRDGEVDGNPYYFLTKEQFEKKIAEGEFYEYENVHGNYYGTSKLLLKQGLNSGDILLKDIDVLGTHNLTERVSGEVKILSIFLQVDSPEVLRQRLILRGEKEIDKRLSRYEMEQGYKWEYDYVITNNNLDLTVSYVDGLISCEGKQKPLLVATDFNPNLVDEFVKELNNGNKDLVVKVAYSDGEFYITQGAEIYLASVVSGKKVCKEIVNGALIKKVDQTDWLKTISDIKG